MHASPHSYINHLPTLQSTKVLLKPSRLKILGLPLLRVSSLYRTLILAIGTFYSPSRLSFPRTNYFLRWLFEKYDGVRAFWNPLKKAFYSRRGNKFTSFPQHIIDSMPSDVFLDGELWYFLITFFIPLLHSLCRFGRHTFQDAMKIPQRMDVNEIDWDRFKYMVFDIPNHEGTYKQRYEALGM